MNALRIAQLGLGVFLGTLAAAGTAPAVILDAASFVAVRHLMPPDDPEADSRHYLSGGIDGAGNVFGMVDSARGHRVAGGGCHCEDPLVWKRGDGYEARVVRGGRPAFTPGVAFDLGLQLRADLDGGKLTDSLRQAFAEQGLPIADNAELAVNQAGASWRIESPATPEGCRNSGGPCEEQDYRIANTGSELQVSDHSPTHPHGLHVGFRGPPIASMGQARIAAVSEDGYVGGYWNTDNWNTYFYDMNEDVFVDHHGGMGMMANNNRIVVSSFADYSEAPPALVASPDAVTEENPRGWIHEFDPRTIRLWAINDDNVVVGTHDNNPIRIRPTGVTTGAGGGFPTYAAFNADTDVLEELGPAFSASDALAISSSDPPYIVGTSFDFAVFGNAGVVWGHEGSVIAKLGANRVPGGISHDGTIAFGSIRNVIKQTEMAALWMTDDGWENFTEVILDDLIADLVTAEVEGADLVQTFSGGLASRCCWVAGVNSAGQVVAQGFPSVGALGGGGAPAGTAVFLLDTMDLGDGVIKGDVNNDAIVDFLDITPFINAQSAEGSEEAFLLLSPDGCFLCADIDMDGVVDFIDITPFVNLLDEIGAAAVPEPASALLFIVGLALTWRRTR